MSVPGPAVETIRFDVRGMTCASCVSRIVRAVRRLDGVETVHVDLRRETVTVRREPAIVSPAELAAAVAEAGYEPDLASSIVLPSRERSRLKRLLGR